MSIDQTAAEQSSRDANSDGVGPSTVTDLEEYVRAFVRERPVAAILATAGMGYLVTRLISHTMR